MYESYICVIAKFTRLCNLRCVYCHDWRSGPGQTMPFAVQSALFRNLLACPDHAAVDVVWHGGEPTLLGKHEFHRILALQRWYGLPGQRINNIVQTNGTRLTPEWVELLKRYRFRVGVSLDGPPEVHDRSRPSVGGRATSMDVKRGLRLL